MRWLAFAAGVVVLLYNAGSVVRTLIVPRGLSSRLSRMVEVSTRKFFLSIANRFESYERKDRVLVLQGPMSLLILLFLWIAIFVLGYGLVMWGLTEGTFGQAITEAGSSFFTLGFAASPGAGPTAVHFIAAASGLVVVALQIAYLPTLYAAFNRRETLVTMLQSRAGSPAWGAEILARHHLVGLLDNLPGLYLEWEQWSADVAESHTNYPILINFRSPHPLRSWVGGLLAVLDSAALYLSLCPSRAPTEARLCIRMGFNCLRDVAASIGVPFDPDPFPDDPIQLTFEDFEGAIHRLHEGGFETELSAEEAWVQFRGWRVNYEAVAYSIADLVMAPPGPWSGPRSHLPELEIVPLRPADRRPGDVKALERPKGRGLGW